VSQENWRLSVLLMAGKTRVTSMGCKMDEDWEATGDTFGTRANRPGGLSRSTSEGADRNRTGVNGFAGLRCWCCLAC